MRRITVYWTKGREEIKIAEIAQAHGTPVVFEWDKDFLKSPIELSPLLFPKRAGLTQLPQTPFDGLPGFINDSIPDGWGRILIRHRVASNFADLSPLDMLQYSGANSIGALSFKPSLKAKEKWADGHVDLDKLQAGVEPIVAGTPSAVIEEFLAADSSPNGLRPKIIAKEIDGKLVIGDSVSTGSEWLIKFRAPEDHPELGIVEYVYSLAARSAGLEISDTRLFNGKGGAYFGTKRFDRDSSKKLHVHTLSGILHVPPINYSVGYETMAKVAQRLTSDFEAVRSVYRLALFNVFSCNQDDHTKNVSFLMNEDGNWRVAPAYDLTFHRTKADEHKMPVLGEGKPSEETLEEFGKRLGLTRKQVTEEVERVKQGVRTIPTLSREYGISKKISQEIEAGLPSELLPRRRKLR